MTLDTAALTAHIATTIKTSGGPRFIKGAIAASEWLGAHGSPLRVHPYDAACLDDPQLTVTEYAALLAAKAIG